MSDTQRFVRKLQEDGPGGFPKGWVEVERADMSERRNLMIIHAWKEAAAYARVMELLSSTESGIADYSVPPWKAVSGSEDDVKASIRARISLATAVVVLNTPGLHRRPMSSYEMETAVRMEKRIVVLQPHGEFWRPIPQVLDGHIYRVAPWRSDVLGRAIQGEYPYDGRIFDIAERVDRRDLLRILSAGVGIVSLVLLVRNAFSFRQLANELAGEGIQMRWSAQDTGEVIRTTLVGAAITGGLTALLTEDWESILLAAAVGGIAGAAISTARVYRAALHGSGEADVSFTSKERTQLRRMMRDTRMVILYEMKGYPPFMRLKG